MAKRVTPAAIQALKEAPAAVYWYKSDLRSFLTHSLGDPTLLSRLDWDDYKRNIVGSLMDQLARNEDQNQQQMVRLMLDVAGMEDFSHLTRLEDGQAKARQAESAVRVLKEYVAAHANLQADQEAAEQRRKAAYDERLRNEAVRAKLHDLHAEFLAVVGPLPPQQRGYRLESVLRDLFELFDLDPKASFRISGEQIDGAFTFNNTDYLLEAKWQREPIGVKELDAFRGKVERKLENTLGLYLSINGFARSGVAAHSTVRPVMILVEGADLMAVLEGRIDLIQLLLRKRRHVAQTGEVLLPIHRILT